MTPVSSTTGHDSRVIHHRACLLCHPPQGMPPVVVWLHIHRHRLGRPGRVQRGWGLGIGPEQLGTRARPDAHGWADPSRTELGRGGAWCLRARVCMCACTYFRLACVCARVLLALVGARVLLARARARVLGAPARRPGPRHCSCHKRRRLLLSDFSCLVSVFAHRRGGLDRDTAPVSLARVGARGAPARRPGPRHCSCLACTCGCTWRTGAAAWTETLLLSRLHVSDFSCLVSVFAHRRGGLDRDTDGPGLCVCPEASKCVCAPARRPGPRRTASQTAAAPPAQPAAAAPRPSRPHERGPAADPPSNRGAGDCGRSPIK
jgi:hypothetical protein